MNTIQQGDKWVRLVKVDSTTVVSRAATDAEIADAKHAALPDQDNDGVPDIVEAQQARHAQKRKPGRPRKSED